ncbi:MAG: HDOD domain-containing protein [Acidobacteria bacterium]|nr:HDOD domain-containing protein [Acidobacteriota bacterium]MBI3662959.1 HDOD domain-containing protein [Acidobacteriota bacterium]
MNTTLAEVVRSRLRQVDSIPTVPAVLRPLLDYMHLPAEQVDVQEIVKLVSYDQAITAQCLQLANSPLFARSHRIESVKGAVISIGVTRLRDVLLSCCLVNLVPGGKWAVNPVAYWEHSFGCALVSQEFARKIRFPDPEKAYLAGLLHDIGELVNAFTISDQSRAAVEMAMDQKIPLHEAEQAVLGFDHAESGALLAEHWQLPEDIIEVIRHHHNVGKARQVRSLVALVSLSDLLCRMRGLGYGYQDTAAVDFVCDPAWSVLEQEYPVITQFDLLRFTYEMDEYTEEVRKLAASVYRN